RGATFPQVDLDRVWRPLLVAVAHHDEIEGEPPEDALPREPLSDLPRLLRDRDRVRRVCREDAAQVALPARPTQELVVCGEQLDPARRRHPELDAGPAELRAADPLLQDAAGRLKLLEVGIELEVLDLEAHLAKPLLEGRSLPGGTRSGEISQVDERIPLSG